MPQNIYVDINGNEIYMYFLVEETVSILQLDRDTDLPFAIISYLKFIKSLKSQTQACMLMKAKVI